jgi:hypothetical protein
MKISIKQEGGLMGLASKAKLDYKTLTEEEQKTLDAIAEREVAKLAETPNPRDIAPADSAPPPLKAAVPADLQCYSISMKKDGKKVEVSFDDRNVPLELVAFFEKYLLKP